MRQISAIIEIGTSKVVSIISEAGQYDEAHILGNAVVPYAGYKGRKMLDKRGLSKAVVDALRGAEKMAGKKCKQIHVGVPADFVKVVCYKAELVFPEHKTITQADVTKLYGQGRSKIEVPKEYTLIHRCPVSFMLDDARRTMEPIGRKASKLTAVISYVFGDKWFIQGITNVLNHNGYSPSTFIASSYASAMRFLPQEKRDSGAILLDIGSLSTCVAVTRGDGIIFHKTLPFGGSSISNDISKVLNVKTSIAEELKKRAIFGLSLSESDNYEICDKETYKFKRFSACQVQQVIEARVLEMLKIITLALDKSGCSLPKYMPLYVTGGTASMRGLREFIQHNIDRSTTIVQPQSTCFNQPSYSAALAVMDLALDAEAVDEPNFFENLKNKLGF